MSLSAGAVRALLCDADGCLFPSEEPAFEASAAVTNRLLEKHGIDRRFSPGELRRLAVGKNFRAITLEVTGAAGVTLGADELESWVVEEKEQVSAHLARVLKPDPAVMEPLTRLGRRFQLAVVSSSASSRLDVSFAAAGLDELFPAPLRFSAEDSLPVPISKPDPAVYAFAAQRLGVTGEAGLAVEDSVSGARSGVAAGLPTVGNLTFVAAEERAERAAQLNAAGVVAMIGSWSELEVLLAG